MKHVPVTSTELIGQDEHFEKARHVGAQRLLLEDVVKVGRCCGTGNPEAIQWALDEIDALRSSLTALVVAAGRMLDGWAEGDRTVKDYLWRELHAAADEADDRHGVHPL